MFYTIAASQIPQSRDGEGGHNEGRLDDIHSGTRPQGGHSGSQYKYYFNIGSIESFERKLEDAQDTLGVDPHDYVPVTYVSEMSWQQELLRLAPTILLIAGYIYFSRRMQGGFGIGGGSGGVGGRGIFNVGKAQVTKLSKKQKDKVLFGYLIAAALHLPVHTDFISIIFCSSYFLWICSTFIFILGYTSLSHGYLSSQVDSAYWCFTGNVQRRCRL